MKTNFILVIKNNTNFVRYKCRVEFVIEWVTENACNAHVVRQYIK